jgi:hypothetical protein
MKQDYSLKLLTKSQAADILLKYHYLKDISKGFKSGVNVGLFKQDVCVGVCIFTGFPVPELSKGMFGLERNDQEGFYELSRLCLLPEIQTTEHNITSWFVARAIRFLKQNYKVRAILSYADADYHGGTIYRACNFKYYGLSNPKSDFWIKQPDGSFVKHTRGSVKGVEGCWKPRSRKHRYVIVLDKKLNILWKEVDVRKNMCNTTQDK